MKKNLSLTYRLVVFLLIGQIGFSEAILKLKKDNNLILVNKFQSSLELQIKGSQIKVKDIFDIKNPARVVLDIENLTSKDNKLFKLKDNNFAHQLRMTGYNNNLRLILDLKRPDLEYVWDHSSSEASVIVKNQTKPVKYTPKEKSGYVSVKRNINQVKDNSLAKIANKNIKLNSSYNTKENSYTPPPTVTDKISPPQIKESYNTTEDKIVEEKIVANPNYTQALSDVNFEYAIDGTPLIKVDLSQSPKYKLIKNGNFYQLMIPLCKVASEHLLLPQFPPQDFEGIRYVKARQQKGGSSLLIGIDDNLKLTAFSKDKSIYLKEEKY